MEEPVYSVKKDTQSSSLEIFFFQTWSGYGHPILMQKPISLNEAIKGTLYYEAGYQDPKSHPLLITVRKVFVKRRQLDLSLEKPANEYFFETLEIDGEYQAGQEVSLPQTLQLDKFIHAEISDSSCNSVELVSKTQEFFHKYEYKGDRLIKATITGVKGTRVLSF